MKSLKFCFSMKVTILPASPRRFSSQGYEVRCVPVSDSEYYTKSNGFSGKIMGVSSRWFSISLRTLRSLRLKPLKETGHLVNVRGRTTNDKGQTMWQRARSPNSFATFAFSAALKERLPCRNGKQLEQLVKTTYYGGLHPRRFKTPRGCAAI